MAASLLTVRERAELTATQDATLDTACVLRTTTEIADGQGGTVEGTSVDVVTVCRIALPTRGSEGNERIVAERIGQVIDVVITVPWSVAGVVQAHSRVYVPTVASPTAIYEVISSNAAQSYGVGLRLLAKRVA